MFKNCDYLEDPIGYKLDRKYKKPCNRKRVRHDLTEKNVVMTGGHNKTKKYNNNKNWRRYLSGKMKDQMKNKYQKNMMIHILNQKTNKNIMKKTKKYYGGNEKNLLNHNTCKNKKSKVLCSLRDGVVKYKQPVPFSEVLFKKQILLGMFGGSSKDNSDMPSEEPVDESTKQDAEEKIKNIVFKLIKEHNEKLHKIIEENPEQVSKVIEDVKQKSKILRFALKTFPKTIEEYLTKYSDKLVPIIKDIDIEKLNQSSVGSAVNEGNAEDSEDPEDKELTEEEEAEERKLLIRTFFVEKVKTQTLFKLAIILKAMEEIFKDEEVINESEMNETRPPPEKEDINVVFPWNFKDPNMRIVDRIKCLNSHITQTKFEREKDPELYDKCFICKHCTLRNTASKVWGGVIKGLLAGNKSKQLVELINNTYGMLREYIEFPFMTEKQYYLTTLISLQLVNHNLEIDKIDTRFVINKIKLELKDLILGIPSVAIVNRDNLRQHLEDLKKCYIVFHQIGIAQEIHGIYYESLFRKYFQIQQHQKAEKLHFLKKIAFKNYELLYMKNRRPNMKHQGVHEKLYENDININDMKYFSHFEIDPKLKNLKNANNYTELSRQLSILKSQYDFLMNIDNSSFSSDPRVYDRNHTRGYGHTDQYADRNSQHYNENIGRLRNRNHTRDYGNIDQYADRNSQHYNENIGRLRNIVMKLR